MTRTRWIGVGLWIASAVCLAAAVGAGFAVHHEVLERPLGVALAVGFAIAAEATFWTGGAVLGFSVFAKRGSWLNRLFAKKAPAASAPSHTAP